MLVGGLLSELDPQKQQRPAHWLRLQTSPEADWRGRLASALAWQLFQEALRCCDGRNLSEAQRSTAGLLAGKLALAMGCSLHSGSVQGSRQQHQAPTAAPAVLELPPALLWDLLHEAIDHALELGASFMQRKADELAVLHGLLEAGAQVFRCAVCPCFFAGQRANGVQRRPSSCIPRPVRMCACLLPICLAGSAFRCTAWRFSSRRRRATRACTLRSRRTRCPPAARSSPWTETRCWRQLPRTPLRTRCAW